MELQCVINAVQQLLDASLNNNRRLECFKVAEEYKNIGFNLDHLPLLCGSAQHPTVVLFGLRCLEHKIRHSWNEITPELKTSVKAGLYELARNLHSFGLDSEGKVVLVILSQIFTHLAKIEWPQYWPLMVEEFLAVATQGPYQASLMLNVFLRLYEDVMHLQNVPPNRRRDMLSCLNEYAAQILSFALSILMNNLQNLYSENVNGSEVESLCRDALNMLSGYLDNCRLDTLNLWNPTCDAVSPGEPFLRLLLELIKIPFIRLEVLDLVLVLLNRKPQQPILNSKETFNFAEILLQNSTFLFTLLGVLHTFLNDAETFSRERYAILNRLSSILIRIGHVVLSDSDKYSPYMHRCTCTSYIQFCDSWCSHLIEGILAITIYPIRLISTHTNAFWITAISSDHEGLREKIYPSIPKLFSAWRRNIIKDGQPSGKGIESTWANAIFDADEYKSFYAKHRTDTLRCFGAAVRRWPMFFMETIGSWTREVLECLRTDTTVSASSTVDLNMDVLEAVLEYTLPGAKAECECIGLSQQLDRILCELVTEFAQLPNIPVDPVIRSRWIICTSILLRFMNSTDDSQLLVFHLKQVFDCCRYCPMSEPNCPAWSKPKCVKNMHVKIVAALFRFARSHRQRLLPYFDAIGSEVSKLWLEPSIGILEKSVLLEMLILLCLSLPQPNSAQLHFLRQLLGEVLNPWMSSSTECPRSMQRVLTACTNGGAGALSVFGFDRPISELDPVDCIETESRIALTQAVLSLLAVTRRLMEPEHIDQLEEVSLPLLEPIFPSVLLVLKAFNELWFPDNFSRIHTSVLPIFDMSQLLKHTVFASQFLCSEKHESPDIKTVTDHLRTFIYDCHNNLMNIVGSIFVVIAPRLYSLPTEQLTMLVHHGCCAALDYLPDIKLNTLLRNVIGPFIRNCPRAHLDNALVPTIPALIQLAVQRISSRWNALSVTSENDCTDEKSVTDEMLSERLARLLSRTFLEFLRLVFTFNGSDANSAHSTKNKAHSALEDDNDDADDVDMVGNHKPEGIVDSEVVGALARRLLAADSNDSGTNTLIVKSLVTSMAWPDSPTCLKSTKWIPQLIDVLVQPNDDSTTGSTPQRVFLTEQLAEAILFGILCALRVNGANSENNLPSLLVAAVKVYSEVNQTVAQTQLRSLVRRALESVIETTNANRFAQIEKDIQNFENKLFQSGPNQPSEKTKRDTFKKLVTPIIGVPLCQRFRDEIYIAPMCPLVRNKPPRHTNENDLFSDGFSLSHLFA